MLRGWERFLDQGVNGAVGGVTGDGPGTVRIPGTIPDMSASSTTNAMASAMYREARLKP